MALVIYGIIRSKSSGIGYRKDKPIIKVHTLEAPISMSMTL